MYGPFVPDIDNKSRKIDKYITEYFEICEKLEKLLVNIKG